MIENNINLNSAAKSCFDGLSVEARLFVFMLMAFTLLLATVAQADGLFDFQMKMAKKGNAEAEYKVGEMYETGFGVKKDLNEATTWTTKSASQGHENANFKLLYWDVEKNGITKQNKAEVEALKTKANEGNPQAEFYVGKMYAHGVGVKKSSDKAITWLNKAALVGILAAERELVTVREGKQNKNLAQQKAKRRADEKKRAELKARKKQAQLEKQYKSQAKKKADDKARIDDITKQNKAVADASLAAEKKAAQLAEKLAQEQAVARRRELQKQALLKKRAADGKKRVTQFESDPCSGKSARFLSTCR